jgi:hypothetical protein
MTLLNRDFRVGRVRNKTKEAVTRRKISCLDQRLDVLGVPLPVR